jgi:hypothetical protein
MTGTFGCNWAGRSAILRRSSAPRAVAGTPRHTASPTSVSASPGLTTDSLCCVTTHAFPRSRSIRVPALSAPGIRILFSEQRPAWYTQAGGGFMSQAIDLPEKVWFALQPAAKTSGMTAAGWIAAHLPAPADANGAIAPVEEERATTWSRQRTPRFRWNGWVPCKLGVSPAWTCHPCHYI